MTNLVSRIVEVAPFRFADNAPEFLLLKRTNADGTYPGIWQIVTGTMHEGELPLHAALRELGEETGLAPWRFWVVPYVDVFYDHRRDEVSAIPFFAAQLRPDDEPALSAEHVAWAWLSFDQAARRLVWPGQRKGLEIVRTSIINGEEAGRLTAVPL